MKKHFYSIRVKKLKYMGEECTVLCFSDMTHYFEAMDLQSSMIEEKDRILNYVTTISHEFRTPVSTSLMFLETIILMSNDIE